MTQVRLTSQFRSQLLSKKTPAGHAAPMDPDQLAADFADWKDGGEDNSYFFSRDSTAANGKFLCHVHMVPVNVPNALELWNKNWERHSRRVSDRYLFYADGGSSSGFLLIAMIDDPGAHEIWNPGRRSEVKTLEEVADRFYHFGEVP